MEQELPRVGDIYRAVFPSIELERAVEEDAPPTLTMKFALFNRWTEIDSPVEGHFMERVSPGAFKKSIKENVANVRAILSHGKDPSLGQTVLGKIERISEEEDGAIGRVSLFRSLPPLLLDGLRAGVYGASFRGASIKEKIDYHPQRSDYNPDGLPEVTRTEIRLRDIGPTPFAAYEETTAMVRCDTDEVFVRTLLENEIARDLIRQAGAATLDREPEPDADEDVERTTPSEDEPPHSAEEVQDEEKEELPSWQIRR